MTRQTVTTTVREYDEEGRVVKETTTTCEYDWPEVTTTPVTPYVPTYPTYPNTPTYPYTPHWTYTAPATMIHPPATDEGWDGMPTVKAARHVTVRPWGRAGQARRLPAWDPR